MTDSFPDHPYKVEFNVSDSFSESIKQASEGLSYEATQEANHSLGGSQNATQGLTEGTETISSAPTEAPTTISATPQAVSSFLVSVSHDGETTHDVFTADPKPFMLTTSDNPYSPFTQFDLWYQWDVDAGYDTCGYLSRVAYTSHDLSEVDEEEALDLAIEEILRLNLNGKYVKTYS